MINKEFDSSLITEFISTTYISDNEVGETNRSLAYKNRKCPIDPNCKYQVKDGTCMAPRCPKVPR